MDRGGDELIGWIIDGVAAALLGAAVGACLLMLGQPSAAVGAGPAIVVLVLAGLRQIRPEPRRFRLPAFALHEVVFTQPLRELSEESILELTEVAAEEPLELVDPLPAFAEDSRVVQLFAPRPLPTPGELARRIDHHLERGQEEGRSGGQVYDLEIDAAAALRQALGELRRSLA